MAIVATPSDAITTTRSHYITCFDAGDASGIAGLFDSHYGRISFERSIYSDRQAISSLYWSIFYSYANQEQHAELSLLPDSPATETANVFIEKGTGTVRAYQRITAQIENKTVAANIMVYKHVFGFKIFFSNQPRLDASGHVYLPIFHLIVPGSTLIESMSIKAAA
ncbi:MAG: hypothetical protein HY617_00925 [Candidatus Sungbacteria bacterium]|nr:hypothetical protein [Candidatus Sungbacteria bacterium]